ncbi:m-phase inducer phosphatase [Tritrichomonas musculus]|uniref:protein-tyrosine-phosphatase n=1 Tax=Tritrichomonas musculus TaxID=1915356 RepID=A0ABR2IYT1_9EUKA
MLDDGIPTPELLDEEDFLSFSMPTNSITASQSLTQIELQSPRSSSDPFKNISSYELATYLTDPSSHPFDQIIILDARFEYEFRGGRIKGAKNITSRAAMVGVYQRYLQQNVCIIFHCEFSQNRGPTLMRMFREHDRKQNYKNYPYLDYPNIFLLQGGYKQFYKDFPDLCVGGYVQMRDTKFIDNGQLKRCHSEYSKSMLENKRFAKPIRRTKSGVINFGEQSPGVFMGQFEFSLSSSQPASYIPLNLFD